MKNWSSNLQEHMTMSYVTAVEVSINTAMWTKCGRLNRAVLTKNGNTLLFLLSGFVNQ